MDSSVQVQNPTELEHEKRTEGEQDAPASHDAPTMIDDSDKDEEHGVAANPKLPQKEADDSLPPDGGFGWVVVICCFFINAWYVNPA
jgi:hypothetical protein